MDRPYPHAADRLAAGPGDQRQIPARQIALPQSLGGLDETARTERPGDETVDQGLILEALRPEDEIKANGFGRGGGGCIHLDAQQRRAT